MSFITSIIPIYTWTRVTIYLYMAHSPCFNLPLLVFPFFPFSSPLLTWNPPSCDRNRPPQSQVARKLTPPVPIRPPVPSLPKSQPPFGFSRTHVHSIRATLQPIPLWSRTRTMLSPRRSEKMITRTILALRQVVMITRTRLYIIM